MRAALRFNIRRSVAVCLLGLGFVSGAPALPVDWSGSLGYSYRKLDTDTADATSHQLIASLRLRTYIWQPWFATAEGGINFSRDSSDVENSAGRSETDSDILSGDAVLNILPRSQTPFRVLYQTTDSRVDDVRITNPLVTLTSEEFTTEHLELRQSYITDAGHRLQAYYATRNWKSDSSGTFDDELMGLELDWRPPRQRLLAKVNQRTTEQSSKDRHQDDLIVDVDHYWYVGDALRVDTKASLYDLDTSFEGVTGLVDTTSTKIMQVSSFAFWRPMTRRVRLSGGLRAYDMSGENSAQSSDQTSLSGSVGAYFQQTKRLRWDVSGSFTRSEIGGADEIYTRQRLGSLYQSDLADIKNFTYRWYATAGLENATNPDDSEQRFDASLGHDAQRRWMLGDTSSITLSLSQVFFENIQTEQDALHRLNHSISLGWNQAGGKGTTFARLTVSDSRSFGELDDEQQLLNFQISRTQNFSRLSDLSGHLTVQTVRREITGGSNNDTVTSATGQLAYQHRRAFGLPRLAFRSDLRVSQASTDEGRDRNEWENRLDYAIGLVNTSLSLRLMDDGDARSSLLYFRLTRRF